MDETTERDMDAALFRTFFDNAPIGKAITALDGSWVRANATLAAMLGYTMAELHATSFLALVHPDQVADVEAAGRALVAGELASHVSETRLRVKDGTFIWTDMTTRLQRSADHAPLHFATYVIDITARKKADRDLRASERRYRRLFESAKDGILILTPDAGQIVDVNPFMTELTGYPREHFLGKCLWQIGPFEDIAASKSSFSELQSQDYVRYEDLPLVTSDGRHVDVEFVSNAYLVDDVRVIQCNIRDITLRKQAEFDLRMLDRAIDAVSQGILITDPHQADNPIVYASPGFTRLTGYAAAEVIGRNCRMLQSPDSDPVAIAILRDAIREEQPCEVEILNVRKDGTSFWNQLVVAPVLDRDGRLVQFVGVQTDVTERRQLEAQYRQAQKMEAVGRLAGGVAHDFNNVLSVIVSYAELLSEEVGATNPMHADLAEISKAASRASALTKQLLAFSRQQVLEVRVLDLHACVAGIEKMLRRLLGADIELTLLPAIDLWNVRADPGQIEQIVMNLAINARDAMPDGGELTIETENVWLDHSYARAHHDVVVGPHVMLAITDTGAGMSKETQARIFEPFFTTKEIGKGTGLGLATVFGIVKQSGGHIWVYSEVGKGTTFKVYLPKSDAVAESKTADVPTLEPARAYETILLVEDDDQVRVLAETILRRTGYVVLTAPNGGEALLICEKHGAKIDLLLTDVVLPRMSGRQLATRLAPLRPAMKVLFMSGYTDDAVLQHGVLDSGVSYLQKPFTPGTLTRKVHEVLRAPA